MIFIETNLPSKFDSRLPHPPPKSLVSLEKITHIDKDYDTTIIFLADGTFVKDSRTIDQWRQLIKINGINGEVMQ